MLQSLDTIIGVIFVFLMFSLVVSAALEVIAAFFRMRARTLKAELKQMLDGLGGPQLSKTFGEHPLIRMLMHPEKDGSYPDDPLAAPDASKFPNYLPAANMATTLLQIAYGKQSGTPVTENDLLATAPTAEGLSDVINFVVQQSGGATATYKLVQENLEKWINEMMKRVTSAYQRNARMYLLLISFGLAAGLNIDTFEIWRRIQNDGALREAIVKQASSFKATDAQGEQEFHQAVQVFQGNIAKLKSLDIPIGWEGTSFPKTFTTILLKFLGILFSALAATLGAPFWFDLLQQFMSVRSVLKPAEPKKEDKPATS